MRDSWNRFLTIIRSGKFQAWLLIVVFGLAVVDGIYVKIQVRHDQNDFLEYMDEFETTVIYQTFESHITLLELMKVLPYETAGKSLQEIKADTGTYARAMAARLANILSHGRLPEGIFADGDPLLIRERYPEILARLRPFVGQLRNDLASLQASTTREEVLENFEKIRADLIEFRNTMRQFNSILAQVFSMHYARLKADHSSDFALFNRVELVNQFLLLAVAMLAAMVLWRLHRTEVDLRAARDGLEATVLQRTEELRQTNERLRAEMRHREQTEEKFRQAQKMEAVGQLTGGIAHDFNNLLQIIIGNSDLAKFRLENGGSVSQLIEQTLSAGRKGAELTRQLLAYSRKQTLDPKILKPDELVSGMAKIIERTLGDDIEVEKTLDNDIPPILIDPTGLETAILNIALNSRAAMPEGGTLKITVGRGVPVSTIFPGEETAAKNREHARITISDTGSGMTDEVKQQAFEPFFTTKDVGEGTGLGLSTIYGFVKQSGGNLSLASEVGKGTTLTLWLPFADVNEAKKPSLEGTPTGKSFPGTVLLVEDDQTVRQTTAALLDILGIGVIKSKDGPEALEALRSNASIDLVLTDLVMPNGMSGVQLVKNACETRPNLKFVISSGHPLSAKLAWEFPGCSLAVLQKPFSLEQLAETLCSLMEKRKPPGWDGPHI